MIAQLLLVSDDSARPLFIAILSDSQFAVNVVNATWNFPTYQNGVVQSIAYHINQITTFYGIPICCTWIKSHVGIEGNEIADKLAKDCVQNREPIQDRTPINYYPQHHRRDPMEIDETQSQDYEEEEKQSQLQRNETSDRITITDFTHSGLVSVPFSVAKTEAKQAIMNRWKQEWKTGSNGRELFRHCINVTDKITAQLELSRTEFRLVSRLQTGHVELNEHLWFINILRSPLCVFCDLRKRETVQHYLLECNAYSQARTNLLKNIHQSTETVDLLKMQQPSDNLQILLEYIK